MDASFAEFALLSQKSGNLRRNTSSATGISDRGHKDANTVNKFKKDLDEVVNKCFSILGNQDYKHLSSMKGIYYCRAGAFPESWYHSLVRPQKYQSPQCHFDTQFPPQRKAPEL
ncbi:hypothetical protein TNCV_2584221 [Trichonephila clavipes]|nr:hypothetical protein TNCV_2584221 [Trichonephila clavipes]